MNGIVLSLLVNGIVLNGQYTSPIAIKILFGSLTSHMIGFSDSCPGKLVLSLFVLFPLRPIKLNKAY